MVESETTLTPELLAVVAVARQVSSAVDNRLVATVGRAGHVRQLIQAGPEPVA